MFERICRANGLDLDFELNKNHIALLSQIFEEREYADFFPFYEKACIVDIGAHAGYFSLFASQNLHRDSHIIAIEPDATNLSLLKSNCATRKNMLIVNAAVSDRDGEMNLYLGRSINHSLLDDYALNEKGGQSKVVRVVSLASLFKEANISQVDFLKMDCEGAEYSIIEAAAKDIFDRVSTISLEFHDLRDSTKTGNVLVKKLSDLGFRVVKFQYEKTIMGLNFGKLIATKLF